MLVAALTLRTFSCAFSRFLSGGAKCGVLDGLILILSLLIPTARSAFLSSELLADFLVPSPPLVLALLLVFITGERTGDVFLEVLTLELLAVFKDVAFGDADDVVA